MNVFYKGSPLYMHQILSMKDKEQERQELLDSGLCDLIDVSCCLGSL